MSTEQDNFAGMTAEQKVKALILLAIRGDRASVPPINKDNIDNTFDAYDYTDAAQTVREGECVTDCPPVFDRNFETKQVTARLPDGSWVAWTYYYGGGKHAYADEVEWMSSAYHVTCTEEQKLVTVQTFAKVDA